MTYEFPIERSKIREFARATHSRADAHRGERPIIPPTFLTAARLAWEPRAQSPLAQLDLDMRRILHAEEEYVFHGPPPAAGQTMHVDTRLVDQWEKEGKRSGKMRFVLVVNEFRDDAGTLIAEQRSTLVETSKAPDKEVEG